MIGIRFTFPGGRYHATPWGRHVNEGDVEWPPSPYRILRALLATWHSKARADVTPDAVAELLEALATDLPEFRLPEQVAMAHTRHYMPPFSGNTTKVFDTFVHVAKGDCVDVVYRQAKLGHSLREALAILSARLGYLGRAESWVEAAIFDPEAAWQSNVMPRQIQSDADFVQRDAQVVPLLAPLKEANMLTWRNAMLGDALAQALDAKRAKLTAKGKAADEVSLNARERARLESALPANLLGALEADTTALRKQGWNRPPGTQWVDYVRPQALTHTRYSDARSAAQTLPTVARYAIAGSVVPRLTQALVWTEAMRSALLARSDRATTFSGKDHELQPLKGHHHAFILPEANGDNGEITHFTVIAPSGFTGEARLALNRMSRLYTSKPGRVSRGPGGDDADERHRVQELQLVLIGVGQPRDFAGTDLLAGQCPIFGPSRVWVSRTSFVATRHVKRGAGGAFRVDQTGYPIGSPQHDVHRLLTEADYPAPLKITPIEHTSLNGRPTRWHEFRTRRSRGKGRRGGHRPAGFRVEFDREVWGPVVLGYGAHFGLGMFVPENVY